MLLQLGRPKCCLLGLHAAMAKTKSKESAKVVKPKKKCCKSGPRCKKCPVVCKRLEKTGMAIRLDDGRYELSLTLRKKDLKRVRAR